jgi:hypothetical protein
MAEIRLTFDQASDPRILALAHQRARERGVPIVIDVPKVEFVELTREQAGDPQSYRAALDRVNGDRSRIRLKS